MQYRTLAVWTVLVWMLVVGRGMNAAAADPQEQIRHMLDDLRGVLTDETLKAPAQSPQRQENIDQIVAPHFDFAEMARRSLGHHWYKITPEQQQEYLRIFSHLVEASLVNRIAYRSEKQGGGYGSVPQAIHYTQQTIEPNGYALVRTAMEYLNDPTKEDIDYLLLKHHDTWLIYDVVTEGASMVTNYRTQFDQIIRQESYAGLMDRLKMSDRQGQSSSR